MTSLCHYFSDNVYANSNYKFIEECNRSAATQSGRFIKMRGALRALHASLNTASMRIVSK